MTAWLGDGTLSHLRDVAEWPDLGARYEVLSRLGRGGMGAVYAARDRLLEREVAVKVLDRAGRDDDAATRLQAESRILARLEHPGIVPVHDAGRLDDGRVFYVMKLVRGARLDRALAAHASLADRLALFLRICDTMAFAHAQGVVHRDLKPENIMLGSYGEVLVLDWGVAAVLGAAERDDAIVGTPGFMAPEQSARDGTAVDARADIFALGALLTLLLPSPTPKPLAAIAAHAQQRDPARRFASVEDLARDVARFRDGERVSVYRESIVERLGRFYQRYRLPILLVLVYMIVRTILLLYTARGQ